MGKKTIKPLAAKASATKSAKAALAVAHARPVDALFSRSRQRVLTVLFGDPSRSFYTNEIIHLAEVGTGGVQRELASLVDAGLLLASKRGNQKHFQANPESAVAAEIYALVRKTMTLAGVLGAALAPRAADIELALLHGTPAQLRDTASDDVSLLLVSDRLADEDLAPLLAAAATTLNRRFSVLLSDSASYQQRKIDDSAFLSALQEAAKIWLLGSDAQLNTSLL